MLSWETDEVDVTHIPRSNFLRQQFAGPIMNRVVGEQSRASVRSYLRKIADLQQVADLGR